MNDQLGGDMFPVFFPVNRELDSVQISGSQCQAMDGAYACICMIQP